MIDYKSELNDRQYEAVRHFEGPLLILAGAGSGKTRVITYRIAHLIDVYGVRPESILAMTFTNKAANEMKERVSSLLGKNVEVFISTFHSACAYFLRRYAHLLGYSSRYIIYDESDTKAVVKDVMKTFYQEISGDEVNRIMVEISSRKENGIDILSLRGESIDEKVMVAYQKRLIKENAMDFSDLLLNMVKILREHREVADYLSNRYRFILVDEFQDTNRVQMELLLLLLKNHRNICVVGDDDQSIYRWRGATIENILKFDEHFKDAKIVKLEQNYRSTKAIITAASELIKNNDRRHKKTIFTNNPQGENITFYTATNDIDEASFICKEIIRLKESRHKNYGDFSILVRTNAQMRIIEQKLRENNIPYEVVGGVKFYERKEIKDIISYLRVIANPKCNLDLERILNIPPRGFGDVTITRLKEMANRQGISLFEAGLLNPKTEGFCQYLKSLMSQAESLSVREITEKIINDIHYREYLEQYFKTDYLDRIANLDELLNSMIPHGMEEPISLHKFLEGITLMSDIDAADLSSGSVSLMTMHSAKGLEFDVVFIAGFEENIIPHFRSVFDPDEIDEERRLLYVAITRAKEKLYISYAKERFQAHLPLTRKVSRFFNELPNGLFTFLPVSDIQKELIFKEQKKRVEDHTYSVEYYPDFIKDARSKTEPKYRVGMSVVHDKFGVGVIRQIEGSGDETKLLIFFEKYGYKTILPSYVKIL
jgi:DNA helicase-2/ATP-dependent DNA helicase PcrA